MRLFTGIRGEIQPHDQECACGCGITFRAQYENERYVNAVHRGRVASRKQYAKKQARKERAKGAQV